MIKEMGMENKLGQMELFLKDYFFTIKKMVKGNLDGSMVINLLESSNKIKEVDKESWDLLMDVNIKEDG